MSRPRHDSVSSSKQDGVEAFESRPNIINSASKERRSISLRLPSKRLPATVALKGPYDLSSQLASLWPVAEPERVVKPRIEYRGLIPGGRLQVASENKRPVLSRASPTQAAGDFQPCWKQRDSVVFRSL